MDLRMTGSLLILAAVVSDVIANIYVKNLTVSVKNFMLQQHLFLWV